MSTIQVNEINTLLREAKVANVEELTQLLSSVKGSAKNAASVLRVTNKRGPEVSPGEIKMLFGKYKGKSLEDIYQIDAEYFAYILGESCTSQFLKDKATQFLENKSL